LEEWIAFRADLDRMKIPYLGPHKRAADRMIARLAALRASEKL
jgi:hypothetical protein